MFFQNCCAHDFIALTYFSKRWKLKTAFFNIVLKTLLAVKWSKSNLKLSPFRNRFGNGSLIDELFCWFQVLRQHFMFLSFRIHLYAFSFIFLHFPFICLFQFLSKVMEMVLWLGHGTFATKATDSQRQPETQREREKEK